MTAVGSRRAISRSRVIWGSGWATSRIRNSSGVSLQFGSDVDQAA
jgi:hypothetical protein